MATYSVQCSSVGNFNYANRFTLYVELNNRDGNAGTNKSIVDYNVYFQNTSGGGTFTSQTRLYFIINGEVKRDETFSVTGPRNGSVSIASGSIEVEHNSDGQKQIGFQALVQSNSYGISGNIQDSFTLTTIPRASSVGGGSGNIGGSTTISITRAADSFTHTLRYSFHNLNETIATGVGTSYQWTIPTSFYSCIPNERSSWGTIYCDTYNGGQYIGTKETTFTATVTEESSRPIVGGHIIDINENTRNLTGNQWLFVKHASTAEMSIFSEVRNYASIRSVTVNGINVGNSSPLVLTYYNVTTPSFEIVTTDSRGFSNTYFAINPNYIDYIPLTVNANFFRPRPTDSEIQLTYSGNYFNGSFGQVHNELAITWDYKERNSSEWIWGGFWLSPNINGNTIVQQTISLGTNFDYQKDYNFRLYVSDKLNNYHIYQDVSVGMPVFYWGKDFFNIMAEIKETLKFHDETPIYWREAGWGDQFAIKPLFYGAFDDSNMLRIMGASGGQNTTPELHDLMTITADNGFVTSGGYYDRGAIRVLPNGNDDHIYWSNLQNGWYWHNNSYPVPNLPEPWGFVEKRGFVGGDFTVMFYTQNRGKIYRKSGNIYGAFGWEVVSEPGCMQEKPILLYDNSSGTTGTITLSESAANFYYLEIFFKNSYNFCSSVKISAPEGKIALLEAFNVHASASGTTTAETRTVNINGTTITTTGEDSYGKWWSYGNKIEIVNYIHITRVIGYK